MTTIRVAQRARFTAISRDAVNDDRLSFRARGILVWLLDKPDDWSIDSTAISRSGSEGRDAVRSALDELEGAGYLERSRTRDPRTQQWRSEAVIHEQPLHLNPLPAKPVRVAPAPENPSSASTEPAPENPASARPAPESQALRLKTVTEDCYQTSKPPLSTDVDGSDKLRGFDHFWKVYPERNGKRIGRGICEGKWAKLNLDEKRAAYRGAVHYAEACTAGLQGAMDPERFLAHRRWTDWQTPATPGPGLAGPRRETSLDVVRRAAANDPLLAAELAQRDGVTDVPSTIRSE